MYARPIRSPWAGPFRLLCSSVVLPPAVYSVQSPPPPRRRERSLRTRVEMCDLVFAFCSTGFQPVFWLKNEITGWKPVLQKHRVYRLPLAIVGHVHRPAFVDVVRVGRDAHGFVHCRVGVDQLHGIFDRGHRMSIGRATVRVAALEAAAKENHAAGAAKVPVKAVHSLVADDQVLAGMSLGESIGF